MLKKFHIELIDKDLVYVKPLIIHITWEAYKKVNKHFFD
jgi:hypothetical protein